MRDETGMLVRRILPRLLIVLVLVILALSQFGVFERPQRALALDIVDGDLFEPQCGVHYRVADQDSGEIFFPCDYDQPPPSVECGPNPYLYNDIGGHWQRSFIKWCFDATDDATRDPLEIICDGLNYEQCQEALTSIGLGGLSWQATVDGLVSRGYWSYECSCVPDGAPTLPKS